MIVDLLAIIAPVFFTAAIGFIWEKRKLPFDLEQITPLVVNIGTPALVLSTLTGVGLTMENLSTALGYAVLLHLGTGLIGVGILLALKKDLPSFAPTFIFANTGNMGLPLALFAFGQDGMALAIVIFAVSAVGQFTIGLSIASGTFDPGKLLRTPIIWAVALAVLIIGFDIALPLFLSNTIELVGNFTIPLMLISLGVSLARLRVREFGLSLFLATIRVLTGIAVGFAITEIFGLTGILRGVIIVQAAMPVAVTNFLLASYYKRDANAVAGMVVVSTIVSFGLLPLVLWLAIP